MRNFFVGLFLAGFLPFIVGFGDVPPDKNIEHVTYLRLSLPGDSINIGSVGFGDSFGLVRWPGWGEEDAWQLSISGAVFAQFNLDSSSMDLINADYVISFPQPL